jgi:hypothetical protein
VSRRSLVARTTHALFHLLGVQCFSLDFSMGLSLGARESSGDVVRLMPGASQQKIECLFCLVAEVSGGLL